MTRRRLRLVIMGVSVAAAACALPAVAVAEEVKAPVSAPMVLSILSQPVELRATAVDRSLRDEPPARPDPLAGEVQPDGSVRYGRVTVSVKNPCPPGTAHYEPPPLPGRRTR